MTQASRTKDQVIVKVTAEDEERRRYRWQCRLSLQQNVMPLKRMWAEAHGVEEEAVLFLDEAGCLVDLEKTPPQLGWKDTVELSSVPASDEWAEGGTAAKRRPKRAKVEKAPEQTQLGEKTQGNGAKMDLDAKPLADLGGSLPGDDEPVEFQAENPKRSGTTAYERYEKYKSAKTIAAAIEKGAARGDIINDFKKGFIRPL